MPRNEELTGVYQWDRRVFQPDDPEQRTVIGEMADGTTIKGRAMAGALEHGLTYRFLGHWSETRWGRQFHFNSFALARPAGEQATVLYLAKGPHIGRARAQRIWNLFGERSLEVVRTEPERIAKEIDGITPDRACEAAEYFRRFERLERVTIEVNDLLANKGFPRALADNVIREWGEEAPRNIREETWPLMRFRGVGFLRCDALYLELGRDPAAVDRQAYCLWHSMASDSEGHTWFPAGHCAKALTRSIRVGSADMAAAVRVAIAGGLAERRTDYRGATWLAESKKAAAEQRLAECVRRAEVESAAAMPRWPATLDEVSPHQAAEYARAASGFLGVLAGSPGTGKTYTLARIVRAIQAAEGAARIAICAPTGKAAVRCTENLARQGVPLVATTIHRLLGVQQVDDTDGWAFVHSADNPLPLDFLFIDESSMCDTTLLSQLLAARPNGCHVLMVGDPDQLSPVGHGAPLRDLIAAGIPTGRLTEIRRNAGRIVRSCAEIRDRQRVGFSEKLDLAAGENLVLLDRDGPESQIAELEQFLTRLGGGKKFDPTWNVQVVVPVNDKSPLARKKLNKSLQQLLNPDGEQLPGCPFRVGDKLVCTKNGTLPLLAGDPNGSPTPGEAYVANGEQARVETITEGSMTLRLWSPDRTIRVPRGKRQEVSEEGEDSEGSSKAGCSFDLAYAISVHKSQGSEWPIVVVMLDGYGGALRLCDRHWLYTAISRAREFCLCIGPRRVATAAVKKSHMWDRKTFLRERIEEQRANGVAVEWGRMLAAEERHRGAEDTETEQAAMQEAVA